MSSFFLLHNLHFALEFLGAIAFLVVAWLAFDAFLIRRDFLTSTRGIGFSLLAGWQVIHAFAFPSDLILYLGYAFFFGGVLFIILNILLEAPSPRPEFKAILVLPAASPLFLNLNNGVVAAGLLLITLLSYRQYRRELKKSLGPFVIGFLFLSLGALTSLLYTPESQNIFWIIGHLFQLLGFFALGRWVWSYLRLRIREELLIIFTSFTLLMAVVVSLTFSSILVSRIEAQTKDNLLTDVKVLELTILSLQEEALAKTRLFGSMDDVREALENNDFAALEELSNNFLQEEQLGFLTVADEEGFVLLRAHALTQKDDNLSSETAVAKALEGDSFVTIETSPVEQFSIRAASPIMKDGEVQGVVIGGFPLDNVLADSIRKITGLEMSIFQANTRVATTALNPDGKTRSTGIQQTDPRVTEAVLEQGNDVTLSTTIFSRPFLAAYLPLKNAEGQIVGMISAAKAQQEIVETANATNRLTLLAVVVLMLLLITPIYFITKRLSEEIA